jgi:hypothetical protein
MTDIRPTTTDEAMMEWESMDHAEARELLEIAAVEPGGFARLVAGDTPEAAALAGHLAGCAACADEMERLRLSATVIREAVRMTPPPELRERTLAFVAAVGRPRGAAADAPFVDREIAASSPSAGIPPAASIAAPGLATPRRLVGAAPRPSLWLAALAAALIIAVAGTAFFVGASRDRQIADQAEELGSLRDVAAWTIRVDQQADAHHVALAAATGSGPTGTLLYAPTTTDVVVVATGLASPPAGMEYRCWVQTGDSRQRIGKMFLGDDIAYWFGPVPSLASLGAGSTFGISLVPLSGDQVGGDPVLTGHS